MTEKSDTKPTELSLREKQKQRRKKITESAKPSELSNAEVEVNDMALTPKEQADINDIAETDDEKHFLENSAKLAKAKKIAIKTAKETVNNSVPSRHLAHRPTFGAATGSVEYHMRETFSFLLGRNAKDKAYIVGLFDAATNVRKIVQGHIAGCPYATWVLVQLDKEIVDLRNDIIEVKKQAQIMVQNSSSISFSPFTSKQPSVVELDFKVPYAYHFADLLVGYDNVLRSIKHYLLQSFISNEEYSSIENKLGKPLRRMFKLTSEWTFVGKEAVESGNETYLAAQHKMGFLPENILNGEKKPLFVK